MKKIIKGEIILICSEEGRAIAKKYLALEDEKRARVEHQVLEVLRARNQREAIRLVELYHESDIAERIFPSGLSVGVSVGDGEVFPESEFDNWDFDDLEGDLKIILGVCRRFLPLSATIIPLFVYGNVTIIHLSSLVNTHLLAPFRQFEFLCEEMNINQFVVNEFSALYSSPPLFKLFG